VAHKKNPMLLIGRCSTVQSITPSLLKDGDEGDEDEGEEGEEVIKTGRNYIKKK
jgi:hypothetical protein